MLVSANIFQPLIDVFQSVLVFFHNSLGVPWGWSIILLTIAVRACLVPLTVKQFGSMQRLQRLQPELKALQAKYKDDKERQQKEMMKFYKDNKVNPLGSCLPLVAQLPVFISLFYMLRKNLLVDICPQVQRAHNHGILSAAHTIPCGVGHGAGFLFIGDLTNKATGVTLIVLILLYIGSQLGSSLLMSSATMDPMQRKIMLFMPLVFVLFFIQYPAGLLVYWITTNVWTIAQQYVVKRRIGPIQAPAAAAPAGPNGATAVVPTARGPAKRESQPKADGAANGAGSGGLGALIRSRVKPEKEKAAVGAAARSGPPPRSPRKKKKRSGRRR